MSYTPQTAFELVESAYRRERLAHAFLISGPPGSGKERLAARIIKLVAGGEKASGFDLFGEPVVEEVPPLDELEGSWVRILRPRMKTRKISVEAIRGLEKPLHTAAPSGVTKVGVVVDADRMGTESSNAFLKTLEEPPEGTLLLMLTACPERLLPTVLSRCVKLPLAGKVDLFSEGGEELVAALDRFAGIGFGSARGALTLKAAFAEVLEGRAETIRAAADAVMKEESDAYKNAIEGDWLARREDFHKASAEAEYLGVRARLFDVLLAWMADVLRLKAGGGGLDFPDSAPVTGVVAAKESLSGLMVRMEALEKLRRQLETNVQEQIALEVGFLKAFG
jgi:DNA polymerase-3 subunit delta'